MLQTVLATFLRLATDKALLEWDGEGDLEVGMAVHGVDEEGNSFNLEDGEYRADDGTVYVVAEGKVTEIREPEVNETTGDDVQPEAETAEETQQETAESAEEEPQAEEEDPRDEQIRNLEAEVARLERENGELRERIAELEDKPAAFSAAEDFENAVKQVDLGNKKLNNLTRILNA